MLLYTSENCDASTADFIGYAAKDSISPGDCLILAHAHATLPKTYAGAPGRLRRKPPGSPGPSASSPNTQPHPRAPATEPATSSPAPYSARGTPTADNHTPAENLAANNLDPAGFDRLLHRIVTAMPPIDQQMRYLGARRQRRTQPAPARRGTVPDQEQADQRKGAGETERHVPPPDCRPQPRPASSQG